MSMLDKIVVAVVTTITISIVGAIYYKVIVLPKKIIYNQTVQIDTLSRELNNTNLELKISKDNEESLNIEKEILEIKNEILEREDDEKERELNLTIGKHRIVL